MITKFHFSNFSRGFYVQYVRYNIANIRFIGYALCDLLQRSCEPPPEVLTRVLCRHPVNPVKRAHATPSKVESLLKVAGKFVFKLKFGF